MTKQDTPIYLDNAATTCLEPRVLEAMLPYWATYYGNASSSHYLGNQSKVALEDARRALKQLLKVGSGNIFFTSGGTESNNWAIKGIVEANKIRHVITSPLEHMSVLAPIRHLEKKGIIQLHWAPVKANSAIDYNGLKALLSQYPRAFVSLMHGNNELGNVTDIKHVGRLCHAYRAIFHSDMVQTLGYYPIHLERLPVDLASASAHKLHGPKGIGLLYVREGLSIAPLMEGGLQERKQRGGTENVSAIVGFAKAVEIATQERTQVIDKLQLLKKTCIQALKEIDPGVVFHGQSSDLVHSLPNIVHAIFPWEQYRDTLLLHLDMAHIYASAGSACMSGTQRHSHVLQALEISEKRPVVRFSFSKYNSVEDILKMAKKIATL